MKIAFFGVTEGEHLSYKEALNQHEIFFSDEKLSEQNVQKIKDADIISIFVTSAVNKNIINALPNLKCISIRSTGFDNVDCDYAKSKGIKVSNVPAYGSHTVAEFAFGLILNLSRNIITANNHITRSLDFNYSTPMEGFDLAGKTLGVIGTGKIGKNVVKIAKGFGMNVIATDMYPDAAFAQENNFEYKSLEEVLSMSDIVTLHTPYTKENHHLINKENIAKMKRGVYLINTARGELVDTAALIDGLSKGIIAGAGLDVLEGEKELKEKNNSHMVLLNSELMKMPNVIITPHLAFYTKEAVAEIQRVTILNIQGFIDGASMNVVN